MSNININNLTPLGGASGKVSISGSLHVKNDITLGGNIQVGDASTDSINFVGEVSSSIIPDVTNTYNIGSSAQSWNSGSFAYISASGNIIGANITASSGISVGSSVIGDTISTTNITASGNISASGTIIADDAIIGSGTVTIDGDNGHITASGNISASGTITGLSGSLKELDVSGSLHVGSHNGHYVSCSGDFIGDGLFLKDNTKTITVAGQGTQGSILEFHTGSGDWKAAYAGADVLSILYSGNNPSDGLGVGSDKFWKYISIGSTSHPSQEVIIQSPGGLDVRNDITSSTIIKANEKMESPIGSFTNVTASNNISASGTVIGDIMVVGTDTAATNMELTVKGDISASGDIAAKKSVFSSDTTANFIAHSNNSDFIHDILAITTGSSDYNSLTETTTVGVVSQLGQKELRIGYNSYWNVL